MPEFIAAILFSLFASPAPVEISLDLTPNVCTPLAEPVRTRNEIQRFGYAVGIDADVSLLVTIGTLPHEPIVDPTDTHDGESQRGCLRWSSCLCCYHLLCSSARASAKGK